MSSIFSFIKELLSNEAYIKLNKKIFKSIGILETILLSELISKHEYFESKNMLQNGWFFNTTKNIEEDTTLSEYQQRNITNKLINMGILECKLKGMPAKKYFKFNKQQTEKIFEKIINESISSYPKKLQNLSKKISDLTLKKSSIINKNKYNNTNQKTIINDRSGFENKSKKNIPVKLKKQDLHSLRLIQYWTSLGHTTQHSTNRPHNKSCLQIIKYLTDLQKGKFAVNRRFDPEWIKKENIPENWFTKIWMPMELKEGLKEASKYSLDGYWPNKNKENFKSLSYILYNDFGNKKRSWLFTAMKNSPQTIKEVFQKIPLEDIVNKFMKNSIWPKKYEFDKYHLGKGLVELKEFSDNLIRDQYNRSHEYFGTLAKLLKEYIAWVDEQDWIEINENIIGTGNKIFELFIKAQERELEIKIKSKGWK